MDTSSGLSPQLYKCPLNQVNSMLAGLLPPAAGADTRPHPPVWHQLVRRLLAQFDQVLPLVQHSMDQARARGLDGQPVPSRAKVLSLFEPHTRVVVRRKLSAAIEFGRQVMLDEVEGGIVTRWHVLADEETRRASATKPCRQ